MGIITSPKHFFHALLLLLSIQTKVFCYVYKVGDLDCWGIPTSAKPYVYTNWTSNLVFSIGDSLLFLYPPSQDSVIQVTTQAYNSCNITDPILYMNNGNSLFNITKPGQFYFTSGAKGNCQNNQKLYISVPGNGSSDSSPTDGASAPTYPIVFGSIPMAPSSSPQSSPESSSSPAISSPITWVSAAAAAVGLLVCALFMD